MNSGRLRRVSVLAVSTTAVAAGLIAVAVGQDSDPAYQSSGRVAQEVQSDQAAQFAVFERPRGADDAMPREARRQVGDSTRSGRNLDLSRAIDTVTGRGWAVPGDGTICLVVPDPVDGFGIGCVPTEQAARQGAAVVMVPPGEDAVPQLTMLVPRGARVRARASGGAARELEADGDGVLRTELSWEDAVDVETSTGVETLPMPVRIDAPTTPTG